MLSLPKGYYAVQSNFENAPKDAFTYKGITYRVEAGVNLFATCAEANAAACDVPNTVLQGLSYDAFAAPVILFSAGEHPMGVRAADGVLLTGSRIFLGEGACIDPNIAAADPLEAPTLHPARGGAGESVLVGGHDFGKLQIKGDATIDTVQLDGFTCRRFRFADWRAKGERPCSYIFRNIIHESPCGHPLYLTAPLAADTALHREVLLENIRITDFSDLGYGGIIARMNAERVTLRRVVCNNTAQVFGFTDITRSVSNCALNAAVTELMIEDCFLKNIGGENGIATQCNADRAVCLTVRNSILVDAAREGEGFLQPHLANEGCRLTVSGCRFVDTRGNQNAITVFGDGEAVKITDCSFEGFQHIWGRAVMPPAEAPDCIECRESDWRTATADAHTVLGTSRADFAALDAYYGGYRPYYGDQHAHTACGGTSDGKFPMKDWPAAMDALRLDFAAIVDHRQMRGFFLPEWDEERFIIGTEPGTRITDLTNAGDDRMHYNMLFPHKYGLAMVLANFPEFEFSGDELTGSFKYPKFTKKRFMELTRYVQSLGGMMVHPHPKSLMGSDDPLDYYIGEHMYLEVMVGSYERHSSIRSYDLWCELLSRGKHVYAAGGSDTHGQVSNACVSTFYSKERSGRAFFDRMHAADYTVGALGMQMLIDGHPMGAEIPYRAGMTLTLRVGDFFAPAFREGTAYELRVYTDKGLAYASMFNGKEPQYLSLAVEPRVFYRAEVVDLTHGGFRIAVGNPIWLDRQENKEVKKGE